MLKITADTFKISQKIGRNRNYLETLVRI